jgi:hypothetical protein
VRIEERVVLGGLLDVEEVRFRGFRAGLVPVRRRSVWIGGAALWGVRDGWQDWLRVGVWVGGGASGGVWDGGHVRRVEMVGGMLSSQGILEGRPFPGREEYLVEYPLSRATAFGARCRIKVVHFFYENVFISFPRV